jgi:nicotinamidase-related amidase
MSLSTMIAVDLAKTPAAVVVLDAQELFAAPDGPFENRSAQPMVDALNAFLPGCRSLGIPVVFSNYVFRDDLRDAGLLRDQPWVEAGHMCASSPWVAIDRRLTRVDDDILVTHHRPSAFFRTSLDTVLASVGADAVVLCGLSVNNAIAATARDAFARDLQPLVVRDCTGAAPWETELDTYFETLATWTAEVATSAETLERLGAAV